MADPVLLLVRTGVLMFFDHLVQIVVNGGAGHNALLTPSLHDLFIDIVAGLVLLDKTAIPYPLPQHVMGFLIDTVRIDVNIGSKLGLRAVN